MTSRLRAFVPVAVLAVVGIAASSAVAEEATFFAEKAPLTLTGTPSTALKFDLKAGTVECEGATFEGKMESTEAEEIVLTPTFSECKVPGVGLAGIDWNGCHISGNGTFPPLHGRGELTCPTGQDVTITVFGYCVWTIRPGALGTVEYVNKGEKSSRDIEMIWNAAEMHYVQIGTTCGGNEGAKEKTFTTGGITGTTTLKGEVGKEQVGIWIE